MSLTLPSFAAQVRAVLQRDSSPTGREQVAALLREALQDTAFVDSLIDAHTPERRIVHDDPALGFCILAHRYTGARAGAPHDHGPSWAIYGQAHGDTVMSDWALVEPPAAGRPGKARKLRDAILAPGMAQVYNEGAIHAPRRTGPTALIRVEGTNLERVARGTYEPVA